MMMQSWEQLQVVPIQYGLGDNGYQSHVTGLNAAALSRRKPKCAITTAKSRR